MTLRNGKVDPNVDTVTVVNSPGAIVEVAVNYAVPGNVGTVLMSAAGGARTVTITPTAENHTQIVYVQKSDNSANGVSISDGTTVYRVLNQQKQVQAVQVDFDLNTLILI